MQISIRVISTTQWQARASKSKPETTTPSYIVIHHTATKPSSAGTESGGKKLARSIQNYHMDHNDWIDSGHNFLNTVGGIILEGRHGTLDALQHGECVRSAHSGNKKVNESPGIENEGIYMTKVMPAAQWNSLVLLCAKICQLTKIKPQYICGHRDFSRTACPGDWLYSQIPELIKQVENELKIANTKRS